MRWITLLPRPFDASLFHTPVGDGLKPVGGLFASPALEGEYPSEWARYLASNGFRCGTYYAYSVDIEPSARVLDLDEADYTDWTSLFTEFDAVVTRGGSPWDIPTLVVARGFRLIPLGQVEVRPEAQDWGCWD